MIRMLFALVLTVAGMLGGALWLAGELNGETPELRVPARLRTVDLGELLAQTLEVARSAARPPPRDGAPAPQPAPVERAETAEPTPDELAVASPPPGFADEPRVEVLRPRTAFVESPDPGGAAALDESALTDEARDTASAETGVEVAARRDQEQWASLIRRMLDVYDRVGEPTR